MTQVSLYGDIPNEIQLEAHSDVSDDDDDEKQNEQIRQRLMDNLPEESFEFDDCDSSENDSRSSSVNHNNNSGFLFNQDMLGGTMNKIGTPLNGSYSSKNSSFTTNGVNLNMLPNAVMDVSDNRVYPMNMNGNMHSPDFGTALHGQVKLNGNLVNGNGTPHVSATKPKKQVTIVESFQKNRGQDEIEESNPTISLIHQQHCPRTENGDLMNNETLSTASNKEEQIQTLLDTKARQLERSEEEVLKLQKDKRSLSHQVGLMKTELNHMKGQHDEAAKLLKLREQDCEYLRTKLHEAIEDYEQARAQTIVARDKAAELESEVGRLKDEIKLLSSIGSSAHQAEVSDIVRQLREKHSAEVVTWKKVVNDLEGQLRTYQRQQELFAQESFNRGPPMSNASCQTDEVEQALTHHPDDHHYKRTEKTKLSIMKDEENGDLLIKEHKRTIVSLHEKLQEIERRFEEEKAQIKDSFQKEIEVYRHKLAVLPGELYKQWEAKQAELGIQAYIDSKPICVDACTSIDLEEDAQFMIGSDPNSSKPDGTNTNAFQDANLQVNFASLMANRESIVSENQVRSGSPSSLEQTNVKETSNVIIQTDETLETYKILGSLLTTWSNEVQQAKANEEECILKCKNYEDEINKLRKDFKMLHKIATKCRKESKLKEENLNKEIAMIKNRYKEVLLKLDQKLDALA